MFCFSSGDETECPVQYVTIICCVLDVIARDFANLKNPRPRSLGEQCNMFPQRKFLALLEKKSQLCWLATHPGATENNKLFIRTQCFGDSVSNHHSPFYCVFKARRPCLNNYGPMDALAMLLGVIYLVSGISDKSWWSSGDCTCCCGISEPSCSRCSIFDHLAHCHVFVICQEPFDYSYRVKCTQFLVSFEQNPEGWSTSFQSQTWSITKLLFAMCR